MDIIQDIINKQNQAALEFTRREEQRIIKELAAVETGTAYVVRDEKLKRELLANIERRGY